MAAELRNWLWWYYWEDDEDEPNPAPLLTSSRAIWQSLDAAWLWFQTRVCWPVERWLRRNVPRFFPPPEPLAPPVDKDGRAPEEWLLIELIGIWNLEYGYGDEYDWQVKRNWDEYMAARTAQDAEVPQKEDVP
jgi:hypothetical protein